MEKSQSVIPIGIMYILAVNQIVKQVSNLCKRNKLETCFTTNLQLRIYQIINSIIYRVLQCIQVSE